MNRIRPRTPDSGLRTLPPVSSISLRSLRLCERQLFCSQTQIFSRQDAKNAKEIRMNVLIPFFFLAIHCSSSDPNPPLSY